MNTAILSITILTWLISAAGVIISLISFNYTKTHRQTTAHNKEMNFLYKRLREFKNFLNDYNVQVMHGKSKDKINYQDITRCQVYFLDTILTSQILQADFTNQKDWQNVSHNENVSNLIIDQINIFGSKLWKIANKRTEWTSSSLWKEFHELLKHFIYEDFYKIIKEIVQT